MEPESQLAKSSLGQAYLAYGQVLLMQKQNQAAIVQLAQAVKLNPVSAAARYQLGAGLLQSGADPLLAGLHLYVAAKLDPSEPIYRQGLVEALTRSLADAQRNAQAGRSAEARDQAAKVLSLTGACGDDAQDLARRCREMIGNAATQPAAPPR